MTTTCFIFTEQQSPRTAYTGRCAVSACGDCQSQESAFAHSSVAKSTAVRTGSPKGCDVSGGEIDKFNFAAARTNFRGMCGGALSSHGDHRSMRAIGYAMHTQTCSVQPRAKPLEIDTETSCVMQVSYVSSTQIHELSFATQTRSPTSPRVGIERYQQQKLRSLHRSIHSRGSVGHVQITCRQSSTNPTA